MTTHKAHVNILHNQCLALFTLAVLTEFAASRSDARGAWIYEHATRRIMPDFFDPETLERPCPIHIPKVIVDYCAWLDDETTIVNSPRADVETLPGVGR